MALVKLKILVFLVTTILCGFVEAVEECAPCVCTADANQMERVMNCSDTGISHLPVIENSSSITEIDVSLTTEIEEFSNLFFQGYPKVKKIVIRQQSDVKLSADVFKNLHELEALDFTGSVVSVLPEGVFQDVYQLRSIIGLHTTGVIPENTFSVIDDLDNLDINIQNDVIPQNLFRGVSVRELKLSVGTAMPVFDIPNLKILKIVGSTSLANIVFSGLPMLEKLDLSKNVFTSFPDDAFSSLTALRMVDLSGSNFKCNCTWLNQFVQVEDIRGECTDNTDVRVSINSVRQGCGTTPVVTPATEGARVESSTGVSGSDATVPGDVRDRTDSVLIDTARADHTDETDPRSDLSRSPSVEPVDNSEIFGTVATSGYGEFDDQETDRPTRPRAVPTSRAAVVRTTRRRLRPSTPRNVNVINEVVDEESGDGDDTFFLPSDQPATGVDRNELRPSGSNGRQPDLIGPADTGLDYPTPVFDSNEVSGKVKQIVADGKSRNKRKSASVLPTVFGVLAGVVALALLAFFVYKMRGVLYMRDYNTNEQSEQV